MPRVLLGGALLALAASVGLAFLPLPAPSAPFEAPEWIGPVHVVDPAAESVLRDRAIRIVDGRIVAVVPAAGLGERERAVLAEAPGPFATPALWDMHAVLTRHADTLELPLQMAHGVTRLRSILNCPHEGRAGLYACQSDKRRWNESIRAGSAAGALTMLSGSHPIERLDAPPEAWVNALMRDPDRPDQLKTYDGLPREDFLALLAAARRKGLEVSGHVPAAVPVGEAASAGLRVIAHARVLPIACSSAEPEIMALRGRRGPAVEWMRLALEHFSRPRCEALWRTLRDHGTLISPTLVTRFNETRAGLDRLAADPAARAVTPWLYRLLWREDTAPIARRSALDEALYERYYAAAAARVVEAERAGVPLLLGSDHGDAYVAPGIGLHQEMGLWRGAGIEPWAILRAATSAPARYAGLGDRLGRLAPGYLADIVFTAGDPSRDPAILREPRGVMQEGRLFRRAALDELLTQASRTARGLRFPARILRDFLRNPADFGG